MWPGSALLGVGLAISGSCPGTVFAQLGAGSRKSVFVLVGGIIGAALYGAIEVFSPSFFNQLERGFEYKPLMQSLHTFLEQPQRKVGFAVASTLALIVVLAELIVPYNTDLEALTSSANRPNALKSLSGVLAPSLAGVAVGMLQYPLLSFVGNHLGSASSYCVLAYHASAQLAPQSKLSSSAHLTSHAINNWWQCCLLGGVTLGAYLSSSFSRSRFLSDHVLSYPEAVFGGILMVFGARLAAGCTSGHGISGMGHLALPSFLSVR